VTTAARSSFPREVDPAHRSRLAGGTRLHSDTERPDVPRSLLIVLGLTAPFLFYLPGFSLPPSTLLVALVAILAAARSPGRIPTATYFALGLAGASAIALGYSVNINSAVTSILYFVELAGLLFVGSRILPQSRAITALVAAWTVAAGVDAGMVIYYRLNPADEIGWFQSTVAPLFVPQGTLRTLFTTDPNNALSPDKAGALFVNANAGSAFLGVAFLMALFLWKRTKWWGWPGFALLDAFAVIASGSTTGLALLVALSVSLLVGRVKAPGARALVIPLVVVLAAAGIYAMSTIVASGSDLISRQALWALAWQAIAGHWASGLGFGGWEIFARGLAGLVGSGTSYPPHNLFLYTWVEVGLLGAVCLVAFFVSIIHRLAQSTVPGHGLVLAAVAWTLLHSMGDNTNVFNDLRTMPMLAVLVGAYVTNRRSVARRHQVATLKAEYHRPADAQAGRLLRPPDRRSTEVARRRL
jgi:O-antigen ligase